MPTATEDLKKIVTVIFRIPAKLTLLDIANLDQWQSCHTAVAGCMMGVCMTLIEKFLAALGRLREKIKS